MDGDTRTWLHLQRMLKGKSISSLTAQILAHPMNSRMSPWQVRFFAGRSHPVPWNVTAAVVMWLDLTRRLLNSVVWQKTVHYAPISSRCGVQRLRQRRGSGVAKGFVMGF